MRVCWLMLLVLLAGCASRGIKHTSDTQYIGDEDVQNLEASNRAKDATINGLARQLGRNGVSEEYEEHYFGVRRSGDVRVSTFQGNMSSGGGQVEDAALRAKVQQLERQLREEQARREAAHRREIEARDARLREYENSPPPAPGPR